MCSINCTMNKIKINSEYYKNIKWIKSSKRYDKILKCLNKYTPIQIVEIICGYDYEFEGVEDCVLEGGHNVRIWDVFWLPNNKIISVGGKTNEAGYFMEDSNYKQIDLIVWDLIKQTKMRISNDLDCYPYNLRFFILNSEDNLFRAVGIPNNNKNTLKIWEETGNDTNKSLQYERTFIGHTGNINSITILNDNRIVSCSDDKTFRIWNPFSGLCDNIFFGHTDRVLEVVVFSDDLIVSCSSDKTFRTWNTTSYECITTFNGHDGNSLELCFGVIECKKIKCDYNNSNDKLLVSLSAHAINVWNTYSGEIIRTIDISNDSNWLLDKTRNKCNCDGFVFSASNNKIINVWNIFDKNIKLELVGHTGHILGLTCLPDDKIVSVSEDNTIRVWDLNPSIIQDKKSISISCKVIEMKTHDKGSMVEFIKPLPDGRLIGLQYNGLMTIWK